MWKLFWIETSRQFHAEELVQLRTGITTDRLKDELEDWCIKVFPGFGISDSHISYGYENLENIIGDGLYPPTPQGVRDWIESMLGLYAEYEYWQDRPYTAIKLTVKFNDKEYHSYGFSKVKYPDTWSELSGQSVAYSKAVAKISKNILKNKLYDVLEFYRKSSVGEPAEVKEAYVDPFDTPADYGYEGEG